MIHASPALLVDKETPILECVKLMNARKVGSLLVIDPWNEGRLVGIFTERDLLKNYVELMSRPVDTRPVRTVMSREVKTLPLAKIKDSARLMLEGGFRHVPIVAGATGEAAHQILGIISMRDLFHSYLENPAPFPAETAAVKKKGKESHPEALELHAKDPNIKLLIKKTLQILGQQDRYCALLDRTGMTHLFPKKGFLALDLDDLKKAEWVTILKAINQMEDPPYTLLFYSPAQLSPDEERVLKQLSKTTQYEAFAKPIDVLALIQCLLSGHA